MSDTSVMVSWHKASFRPCQRTRVRKTKFLFKLFEGRITIEGYTTHYNHCVEGKHLSLLDSERQFIKYHAQMGLSIREIMELIHRTIGAAVDEDDPLRFLTNRTVRNVINSVNVSRVV